MRRRPPDGRIGKLEELRLPAGTAYNVYGYGDDDKDTVVVWVDEDVGTRSKRYAPGTSVLIIEDDDADA